MYRGVRIRPSEIIGVVLDIDGTLLKPGETLRLEKYQEHDNLLSFFRRLPPRKARFTFATGRAFSGVRNILSQVAGLRAFRPPKNSGYSLMPVILYNGSVIASSNARMLHRKWEISSKTCIAIFEKAIDHSLRPLVYCTSHKVLLGLEEAVFSISKFNEITTDFNGLRIKYVEKPTDLNIQGAVAILLYGALDLSFSERRRLLAELENLVRTNIVEDRIEISPKNADKGVALMELAKILDWNTNRVMVVGDNVNDIEMLKVAGMSVALANSPPEVKEAADYVTKRSYAEGVIEAILNGVIKEEWKVRPKNGEHETAS